MSGHPSHFYFIESQKQFFFTKPCYMYFHSLRYTSWRSTVRNSVKKKFWNVKFGREFGRFCWFQSILAVSKDLEIFFKKINAIVFGPFLLSRSRFHDLWCWRGNCGDNCGGASRRKRCRDVQSKRWWSAFFFLEKGKEVGMSITIVVMEH